MSDTPTPSPAFAAALARYTETLHALYAPSRLTGYFDTAASYTAARAEVLRVHMEEVERYRSTAIALGGRFPND